MLATLQGSPMANPESLKNKAWGKCLICRQVRHWAKECPNHDMAPKLACYWDIGHMKKMLDVMHSYTYYSEYGLKSWKHQMLAQMWSNWNYHTLLIGITVQSPWKTVSYIVKYTPLWLINSIPTYVPKRTENMCPTQNLYKNFVAALS